MTHDQHIIGHFCHHSHIVGDQQQAGGKRLLQFAHQLEDLRLNSDVEGRGRLIGNQHLWLAQHCHGDHHPLAHTAGKLVRILLQALLHMTDFDRVQHRADPAAPFTAAQHFVALQRLFQLLAHRHQRIERGHRFLKIMATDLPRSNCICRSGRLSKSRLSKIIAPHGICASSGSKPMIASEVSDLPLPDSPAMHRVFPARAQS
nr:Uncharacterised protein [Klebsiella pneumoniae]